MKLLKEEGLQVCEGGPILFEKQNKERNKLRRRVQIPLGTLRMASVLMAAGARIKLPTGTAFSPFLLFYFHPQDQKGHF